MTLTTEALHQLDQQLHAAVDRCKQLNTPEGPYGIQLIEFEEMESSVRATPAGQLVYDGLLGMAYDVSYTVCGSVHFNATTRQVTVQERGYRYDIVANDVTSANELHYDSTLNATEPQLLQFVVDAELSDLWYERMMIFSQAALHQPAPLA